MFKQY